MNACVGAFAAASVGVGIGSVPMVGISLFAGPIAGASGPFTQQQAGRSNNERRTVVIDVRMATGFHGTRIRRDQLFTKGAASCARCDAAHGALASRRLARPRPRRRVTSQCFESCRVGGGTLRLRSAQALPGQPARRQRSSYSATSHPSLPYHPPHMDYGIEVNGLTKHYDSFVAVKDLSFAVKRGEVLGLVGPNGAGKTTTLRALAGIHPPTDGTIRICGFDLRNDAVDAKRHLAFMPDEPRLFDYLTVE